MTVFSKFALGQRNTPATFVESGGVATIFAIFNGGQEAEQVYTQGLFHHKYASSTSDGTNWSIVRKGGWPSDFVLGVDTTAGTVAITQGLQVTELATTPGLGDGEVKYCNGYAARGDGGGGEFYWEAGATDTPVVGLIIAATGGRWKRNTDGTPNVRWFGAKGDGVADDTAAFKAAQALGVPFRVPATSGFYRIVGPLNDFQTGGMIGDAVNIGGTAAFSKIRFEACTSTTAGAIRSRAGSGGHVHFENLYIWTNSWDPVSGCSGYGMDLETTTIARNVVVANFKRSGWFFHQNMAGNAAPYMSIIENCQGNANGHHGCIVGSGANAMTFINWRAEHNGAPSYGVNPSASGSYDGFYVDDTADGAGYPGYTPEALAVIGGDCSRNSRYGWNFHSFAHSAPTVGYAEGNWSGKEIRVGDCIRVTVQITQMYGGIAGFLDGLTTGIYKQNSRVLYGGKVIAPTNVYDLVASQTDNDDEVSYAGAPQRAIFLSRSDDFAAAVYCNQNATPDGTSFSKATASCATFAGFGTYAFGLGSGSHHIKVEHNKIRLPQLFYWASTTGWGSGDTRVFRTSAKPSSSGTAAKGDIAINDDGAVGEPAGWYCTVAGSPDVWEPFGVIGETQSSFAKASGGGGQSVPDATQTTVTLTEDWDPGNAFASNTYTAPVAGYYQIHASLKMTQASGWMDGGVWRIGAANWAHKAGVSAPANGYTGYDISSEVHLTAGETIDLRVYQSSGGAADVYTATFSVRLMSRG